MAPILSRAGLTADADLVHRVLVSFGQSTAAALAGELRLSHGRILTALSHLHTAGLVSTRGEGITRRWSANRPKDRRVPNRSGPYPYPQRLAALVDNAAVKLGDDLHHFTSRPATQRRLDEIYSRGPKELLTINPEQAWDEAALRAGARASHWIANNNIAFRELGANPVDPGLLLPYGGRRLPKDTYRRMPGVPMKLIIFDRRVAFFPVDPGNFERGYLEVGQTPIVESLVAMFEKHWAGAVSAVEEPVNAFRLSPREEAIVEQLVLGHTDATAARALHISERTVSSIVRSLMERLDVRNRFQLGVALGRLNAAPLPPPAGRGKGDDGNPAQRSATST